MRKEFTAAITAYRNGAHTEADSEALLKALIDYENKDFVGDNVETSGGFYPFVFWDRSFLERNNEVSNVSKSWFVLPLLSGGSKSDSGSSLGILCPLLYFGATKIHDDETPHPGRIIPANATVPEGLPEFSGTPRIANARSAGVPNFIIA